MIGELVDAKLPAAVSELTTRVLAGGEITRDEALRLFGLEATSDIFDLYGRGQPHPRAFQGQQDPPLLDRQRQGGSVLGELQLLRAVVLLSDRFAQIRLH